MPIASASIVRRDLAVRPEAKVLFSRRGYGCGAGVMAGRAFGGHMGTVLGGTEGFRQAGGTFPNGAAPEIIDHGRTGYLCPGEDEMTAAVARVPQIDRRQCRAAAECRFSLARMAAGYDRLYRAILEHPGQLTSAQAGSGTL